VEFFQGSNDAVGPSEKLQMQTNQEHAMVVDDSIRNNGNIMSYSKEKNPMKQILVKDPKPSVSALKV
jgi:hypothetical protein